MKNDNSKENYFSHSRSEMLKYIPVNSRNMLDIGCGDGSFASLLKNTSDNIWGIEPDRASALLAEKRMATVLTGSVEYLLDSLPDDYFDCIICNDVIEHLADPWTVVSSLKKKISPDGVFVCSIPNVLFWKNIVGLFIKRDWKYTDSGILDRTHLRFFTKKSIIRFVHELDCELITIEGINMTNTPRGKILNFFLKIIGLGEARYLQYACVFKPMID
jgi:2-polyprenyl-3-methyl-5-hydroxy-6-metoxy-1,4-benzoquinol methylase